LFSPLQWQTLLWPICFLAVIPIACLGGILRCNLSEWKPATKFIFSLIIAGTATLSFAPGMLCWILPLPIFLWIMPMPSAKVRRVFVAGWLLVSIAAVSLYFRNFHNATFAAYSYNHGAENAMEQDMSFFFKHPVQGGIFVLHWLGAFMSHGLHAEQDHPALFFGFAQVSLYLFGTSYLHVASLAGSGVAKENGDLVDLCSL